MNDSILKEEISRICRRFYIPIFAVHVPIECELVSKFLHDDIHLGFRLFISLEFEKYCLFNQTGQSSQR